MANKLREIFSHGNTDTVNRCKRMAHEAYVDAVKKGHCVACTHYSYDPYVPGYVTYEGDCDLGMTPFFGAPLTKCKSFDPKEKK